MDVVLEVDGAVNTPLRLSANQLRDQYPPYKIATSFQHDDHIVSTSFTGARLWDVLEKASVKESSSSSEDLRVMARAKDQFRCILRWHEIDPSVSSRLILIAYEQEDQPLAADEPLRLVVPGDEHGRRYLRGLAFITVLD